VGYLFSQKGLIEAKGSEDEVLLAALEAGAEDVRDVGDQWFEVVTAPGDLQKVRTALEAAGLELEAADITQLPSTTVPVAEGDARKLLRLIDALDELDDVQAVYSNYDIDDEVMEKVLEEV
jgi:transcriptional/translational regulatory protein YebC/TACO1